MLGSLIIPTMFSKGWQPSECTAAFESQASVAFQSWTRADLPLFSTMAKTAMALFYGAIYPERHLERVLKDVHGSDTKMLDPSYATTIGTNSSHHHLFTYFVK